MYLTLLYHWNNSHNSAPIHFACLPLSMILFMWQVRQNTQEPMGKLKGQLYCQSIAPQKLRPISSPSFLPSKLLMGRHLRTKVPAMPSVLKPNVQDSDQQRVQLREDEYRSKQQIYHDKWHQVRALPLLITGEQVWVRDQNREDQILEATKQKGPT